MSAYSNGCGAAGDALGLTKTAMWPSIIRFLLPAGATIGRGASRLAGARGALTALGRRLAANKGMVALGAGLGALSPGTAGEKGTNAAIQGVAGAFGVPGMMAGSVLGPLVGNKLFGENPESAGGYR